MGSSCSFFCSTNKNICYFFSTDSFLQNQLSYSPSYNYSQIFQNYSNMHSSQQIYLISSNQAQNKLKIKAKQAPNKIIFKPDQFFLQGIIDIQNRQIRKAKLSIPIKLNQSEQTNSNFNSIINPQENQYLNFDGVWNKNLPSKGALTYQASNRIIKDSKFEFSKSQDYHLKLESITLSILLPNNVRYKGTVQHNKNINKLILTGRGEMKFSTGQVYNGKFLDGRMQGRGVFEYQNGQIYEGQFKNGKKHGTGILYFNKNKKKYYIGDWKMGKMDGKGQIIINNEKAYKGIWKNGVYQDQG